MANYSCVHNQFRRNGIRLSFYGQSLSVRSRPSPDGADTEVGAHMRGWSRSGKKSGLEGGEGAISGPLPLSPGPPLPPSSASHRIVRVCPCAPAQAPTEPTHRSGLTCEAGQGAGRSRAWRGARAQSQAPCRSLPAHPFPLHPPLIVSSEFVRALPLKPRRSRHRGRGSRARLVKEREEVGRGRGRGRNLRSLPLSQPAIRYRVRLFSCWCRGDHWLRQKM
jgi:hypothetical protein